MNSVKAEPVKFDDIEEVGLVLFEAGKGSNGNSENLRRKSILKEHEQLN